jgi:DNA-binding response OmpR family regulator
MKKKILVVEDTIEALENLRQLLELEGFEVVTAANGADAIHKFYLFTPDIVITDLQMPKMDGFAFIEEVKKTEALKSIPIIVFSANATSDNEQNSLKSGAALFLKKPCPTEVLINAIHTVLNGKIS